MAVAKNACELLGMTDTEGYRYLMQEMTLNAKMGMVSMSLKPDTIAHFKTRLIDDGFEVFYDSISWANAAKPFPTSGNCVPFNQ